MRTPAKLADVQAPELEIIAGDVLDAAAVSRTVQGCGVVVSVFGQVKGSPPDVQTRGTQNSVTAMQQQGIDKIISLSGGGLPCAQDHPKLADKLIRGIMKLLVPQVLTAGNNPTAAGHADVLRGSGRRWIIARGPRLTNEPAQGRYRVGWVGVNSSTKLSRADRADFLLTQIEDEQFVEQMPVVSN